MEKNSKSLIDKNEKQTSTEPNNDKLFPSQYYVDLFYSQLALSYYGSLYFHWLSYSGNIQNQNFETNKHNFPHTKYKDPLSYLNNKKVNDLFDIHSDVNQDFGFHIQLTKSIVYRNGSSQVLLSQFYDYNIENFDESEVPTEFSLIGGYDSKNKNFAYLNEKKYSINPWERYHISILMKAIFIFMFFDVSKELYIILISLYFLYIKGFFDSIQEIFEKISSNHPMEATLADLRRRRAEIEQEALQNQREQDLTNHDESDINYEDLSKDLIDQSPISNGAQNKESESLNFNEFQDGSSIFSNDEMNFVDSLSVIDNEELRISQENKHTENQTIRYYTCVLYQTIGMYVLTLMPWWNPDPTYLV